MPPLHELIRWAKSPLHTSFFKIVAWEKGFLEVHFTKAEGIMHKPWLPKIIGITNKWCGSNYGVLMYRTFRIGTGPPGAHLGSGWFMGLVVHPIVREHLCGISKIPIGFSKFPLCESVGG